MSPLRSKSRWLLYTLVGLVTACQGERTPAREGDAGSRSEVLADSGLTPPRTDAAIASDLPDAAEPGTLEGGVSYTMDGVYRCCEQGHAKDCCDGTPPGICFAFGGNLGRCTGEGEELDAKDTCAACCSGLERMSSKILDPESDGSVRSCVAPGVFSLFICIRCGDGTCGKGETACDCPADCRR